MRAKRFTALATALAVAALVLTGCSATASSASSGGKIVAVGAENQYADVISQIGGDYVDVSAVMSNPNTDPHTFEASPKVAAAVSQAELIVQNGIGYDSFMNKIESSSPSSSRTVIVAQKVLGLPDSTPNPHLWYKPDTMPAVAKAIAAALSAKQPQHATYFANNLAAFEASLKPWNEALARFAAQHPDAAAATTEPVADYMLAAAGIQNKTPWRLQSAIMNDTDPSPQAAAVQQALFTGKKVGVFVYNQQVTDTITSNYLSLARANGIPVVGVYETMPSGYTYQRWMMAELNALSKAFDDHESTEKL